MPDPVIATEHFQGLIGQALAGLLSIPVLWYMLRDLKTNVAAQAEDTKALRKDVEAGIAAMQSKLHEIELQVAGDATKHDVRHLKEAHAEIKKTLEELRIVTSHTERELGAVWSKIGDRPEDIKRRGGR